MGEVATRFRDWMRVVGAHRNRAMIYTLKADPEQAMIHFQKTVDLAEPAARSRQARDEDSVATAGKQRQTDEADRARWQRNALIVGTLLTALLGVVIAAYLLNRARLQRLEEAQALRRQIAHDLHDEVGSTLSSISLLI